MAVNHKYFYLRLPDNFFDKKEVRLLQSMPDGFEYSDILIKLYLLGLEDEGRLTFNGSAYTPSMIASVISGHSQGTVEKALSLFQQLGLLETLNNGTMYISQMQHMIGHTSTENERQKKYRDRIKAEKALALLPESVTDGVTNVTASVTEESRQSKSIETRDRDRAKSKKSIFNPPTVEQVEQFAKENDLNINANRFFTYWRQSNWKQNGRNINWQQKAMTWHESTTKGGSYHGGNRQTDSRQVQVPTGTEL